MRSKRPLPPNISCPNDSDDALHMIRGLDLIAKTWKIYENLDKICSRLKSG